MERRLLEEFESGKKRIGTIRNIDPFGKSESLIHLAEGFDFPADLHTIRSMRARVGCCLAGYRFVFEYNNQGEPESIELLTDEEFYELERAGVPSVEADRAYRFHFRAHKFLSKIQWQKFGAN